MLNISMLRKYSADPNIVIEYEPLKIQKGLTYEGMHVRIMNRKERVLRTKRMLIVKFLWRTHRVEKASWEADKDMRGHYLHLLRFEDLILIIVGNSGLL